MGRYIFSNLFLAIILSVSSVIMAGCGGDTEKQGTNATAAAEIEHAHEKGEAHKEGGKEHGEHEEESNEVAMTPEAVKESGITVEKVTRQPLSATFTAPGRVVPTQNGIAHVGTIIGGRISRLFVSEGSYVGKGSALAEIEAFDIGELKGEYLRARAEVEQTKSALARQEKLAKEGIGAQRTLEEAQSSFGQAVAAQRAAETKLRAVGLSPGNLGSGGAFSSRVTLRSPISGMVARRGVVLGEFVEPSKDVFEVVNTSTVWIDAQLSPQMAASVSVGGVGFIRDQQNHRHSGTIRFISPTVDPESRTVTVRTEVSNPNVHLRPETFVTVEFERSVTAQVLAVPTVAIEQEGTNYYVYREHEPNTFERIEVKAGEQVGEKTVIEAGLKEDDRIAVQGVFYLKSARLKGELQEHEH